MSAEAPASWASLAVQLRTDSPIGVLEQFERQLKETLTKELTAPPDGGRIRALAVSTAKRPASLPDLPTVAEAGVPGYDSGVWYGVLAPAGTPRGVVERLNAEFARASAAPRVKELYAVNAAEAVTMTPAELQTALERDVKAWAVVVEATGVKLQ